MAINQKKLGLYAITGILAAVIVIAAVMTAGVQLPTQTNNGNSGSTNTQANTGTLRVYIKDAPVTLENLYVTIDSVEVQSQDGSGWTTLTFTGDTGPAHFDLLTLQEIAKDLATQDLPVGTYNKIRLHVQEASAVFSDSPDEVTLKVPSDKIDIIVKFEIKADQTTQVLIDMTADFVAISNSHNLKPVIKATVIPPEETSQSSQGVEALTTEPPTTTSPPTSEPPTETPTETPTTEPTLPTETPTTTSTADT